MSSEFKEVPNSFHPVFKAETCNLAAEIRGTDQNPIFMVAIMTTFTKDFEENAHRLQNHILNAIRKAIDDALVPVDTNSLPH